LAVVVTSYPETVGQSSGSTAPCLWDPQDTHDSHLLPPSHDRGSLSWGSAHLPSASRCALPPREPRLSQDRRPPTPAVDE